LSTQKFSIHQRILKKKKIKFSTKILSSAAIFSTDNKKECQHIRMISEGSCDTQDWSNDGEHAA